jgi:hypothetical protein
VLKTLQPGDSISLTTVNFGTYDSILDTQNAGRELQRLSRLLKGSPDLIFEIRVLFQGYRSDSVRVDPDLTETKVDSVRGKYIDIDTLGQLFERDTLIARQTFHNDRTMAQARAIATYLISQGVPAERLALSGRAVPLPPTGTRRTTATVHVLRN